MATSSISGSALALRDVYTDLPSTESVRPPRRLLFWSFRPGHNDAFRACQLQHAHPQDTSAVGAKMSRQSSHQFDFLGT